MVGVPFGCVLNPLEDILNKGHHHYADSSSSASSSDDVEYPPVLLSDKIARCEYCLGYINPYCPMGKKFWRCSICDRENAFGINVMSRYMDKGVPEMNRFVIEYEVDDDRQRDLNVSEIDPADVPVWIVIIDVNCSTEIMDNIIAALLKTIEKLPPSCLIGIVTYSHKLGIFNLKNSMPSIQNILIQTSGLNPLIVDLDETIKINEFLVTVSENMECIINAISVLSDLVVSNEKRGLGSALFSLIQYLDNYEDIVNVRMMCFVNGAPDYGRGSLKPKKKYSKSHSNLLPQNNTFREIAEMSVDSDISIDLICVKEGKYSLGLASFKFLSTFTGGDLRIYELEDIHKMRQDVVNIMTSDHAYQGILKIRTSPGFKIKDIYGSVYRDKIQDDIVHIKGANYDTTIAFDFQYEDQNGLTKRKAAFQIAYAYSFMPGYSEENGPIDSNRYRVRRRLRVFTIECHTEMRTPRFYPLINVETILTLLWNNMIRSVYDQDITEARYDLTDWLKMLLTNYNRSFGTGSDFEFKKATQLIILYKYIHSLLNSDVLSLDPIDTDMWVYITTVIQSPEHITKYIFPTTITAFKTEYDESPSLINFDIDTINSDTHNIYLLDQHLTLSIYTDDPESSHLETLQHHLPPQSLTPSITFHPRTSLPHHPLLLTDLTTFTTTLLSAVQHNLRQ